jgi:hypothetical protein
MDSFIWAMNFCNLKQPVCKISIEYADFKYISTITSFNMLENKKFAVDTLLESKSL